MTPSQGTRLFISDEVHTHHDPLLEVAAHSLQDVGWSDPFWNVELVVGSRSTKALDHCVAQSPGTRVKFSVWDRALKQLDVTLAFASQQLFIWTHVLASAHQRNGILKILPT